MTVIAEFGVSADDFELGRVLDVTGRADVELEQVVPLGDNAIPMFWLYESDPDEFGDRVRDHQGVVGLTKLDETSDRTLFALDWDRRRDALLTAIEDHGGYLLNASGSASRWTFHVRFPNHDSLSTFGEACRDGGIAVDVQRVFNPTPPDTEEWYGLTQPQRETLLLAVRRGYYDIPREISTQEVADALGIFDQAVTERLRRAIVTLVENTLLVPTRDGPTVDD